MATVRREAVLTAASTARGWIGLAAPLPYSGCAEAKCNNRSSAGHRPATLPLDSLVGSLAVEHYHGHTGQFIIGAVFKKGTRRDPDFFSACCPDHDYRSLAAAKQLLFLRIWRFGFKGVGVTAGEEPWLVRAVFCVPRDHGVRFPDRAAFVASSFEAFVGDFCPKLFQRSRCRLVRMPFGVVRSPRHLSRLLQRAGISPSIVRGHRDAIQGGRRKTWSGDGRIRGTDGSNPPPSSAEFDFHVGVFAAIWVTSGGVNPTSTIEALALYIAENIKKRLATQFD